MASATYFVRGCPTCGRKLQVRLEYMGRIVVCQHCNAEFKAGDGDGDAKLASSSSTLLTRADQLLAATARSGLLSGRRSM